MRPPSFPRLALCTVLLLLPVDAWPAPEQAASSAKAAQSGNRYLIVVENSASMQKRDERLRQAVFDLVYSGILGRLEAGDTFGLWLYNSDVDPRFPMQIWDPAARLDLGTRVNTFVRDRGYQHRANPEELARSLGSVVESVGDLTVVIFSDGNDKMTGTPFDREINAFYRELGPELEKAREPFITALVYERRQLVAYAVARPGETLSLPPPTRTSSGRKPGQGRRPAAEMAEGPETPAKGGAGLRPTRVPQPIVITRESNQAALAAAQTARSTFTPSVRPGQTNPPSANAASAAESTTATAPIAAAPVQPPAPATVPPPSASTPAPTPTPAAPPATNVVVVVVYTNAPTAHAAGGGPPLLDPLDGVLNSGPVATPQAGGPSGAGAATTRPSVSTGAAVTETAGAPPATSPPPSRVSSPTVVQTRSTASPEPRPSQAPQPPVPAATVATPPTSAAPTVRSPNPTATTAGTAPSPGPLLLSSAPPLSLPSLEVHARSSPLIGPGGVPAIGRSNVVTAVNLRPPGTPSPSHGKLWAALALLAGAIGLGAVHFLKSRPRHTGSYISRAMPNPHAPKPDPKSSSKRARG
jgi:hypothetical protein